MNFLFESYANSFIKSLICLFRSLCFCDSDSICNSMNMCINSDIRHIIEYWEDNFCCFYSYSRKCLNEFEVIWYDWVVFFRNESSGFFDKSWFVPKEINVFQISFDFLKSQIDHILRVFHLFEECRSNLVDLLICRLSWEYYRSKKLKWCWIIKFDFFSSIEIDYLIKDDISSVNIHS